MLDNGRGEVARSRTPVLRQIPTCEHVVSLFTRLTAHGRSRGAEGSSLLWGFDVFIFFLY